MRRIALITVAGILWIPATVFSQPTDYETQARALYQFEPGYAEAWPVEFHVRVLEPLVQQVAWTTFDLGETLSRAHVAERVSWGWGQPGETLEVDAEVRKTAWSTVPSKEVSWTEARDAWAQYLSGFEFVEHAAIKIVSGEVPAPGRFEAAAKMHVAGRGGASGAWRYDKARVHLSFAKTEADGWRLAGMRLESMTSQARGERMFADVTESWLAGLSSATVEGLRGRSVSDDIHRRLLSKEGLPPGSRLQSVAMDAHPGVVVVDIDGDRWDDLYVWDVLGPATLLRNVDGGSFEDATERFGLAFSNISAASFADLNNDGTPDLVLGRWFDRSAIYTGERTSDGLRFLPVSTPELPREVATVSVADVNKDGRLDVFFGTSAHDHHGSAVRAGTAGPGADSNVNQIGPPNMLLLNGGNGRWLDGTAASGLTLRRNTLQASFADINGDGLPDLFLGNDFAPANLYVNLGARFVDASAQTGADQVFFGMGASWGDVDGDGDPDLFASAMSSTAGQRIMAAESHFDPSLSARERTSRRHAARGNTLLRNDHETFADVTGNVSYSPARPGGWAYGGQFFDADNDGWLDLYVPNGFFTAEGARRDAVFRDL